MDSQHTTGTNAPASNQCDGSFFTICGMYRDRKIERAFRQSHAHLVGKNAAVTTVIAVLVFFGALPYDYFALQLTPAFWLLFSIRVGGLLLGMWVAWIAYRYRNPSRSWLIPALIILQLYIELGFLMVVSIHGGGAPFHTMSAMAIILAFYVFLPNFSRIQFLLPPLFTLAFLACMNYLIGNDADDLLIPTIILILINALGWQSARLSNRTQRLEYFNLKSQHDLNDKLREEITHRQRTEGSLHRLFEAAPVPMVLTRRHDGKVLRANKLALELFHVSADELDQVMAPDFYTDPAQRQTLFEKIDSEGKVYGFEVKLMTLDGHHFEGLMSANGIEYDGYDDCILVGVMDITEMNLIKRELEQLANIDALTGLNNRRAFFAACERELRRQRRNGELISIMLIDVDKFKRINDQYGHAFGDEVLKQVARRLQEHVREFDILGRIGGEEFAVVLPGLDTEAAKDVAERLRSEVSRQIKIQDGLTAELTVTISIGIAPVAPGAMVIDLALNQADHAMYAAKHHGRNRVEVATSSTGN